jgi:diguanylate cyclase (GGDEF)-like protein
MPVDRIALLIEQPRNRALLAEMLSRDHVVVPVSPSDEAAHDALAGSDVCIADGSGLDRALETLRAVKAGQEPVVWPVLLLTARADARLARRDLWRTVDEILLRPVERNELRARIETLLRARRLSVELRDSLRRAERTLEQLRATQVLELMAQGAELPESLDALARMTEQNLPGSRCLILLASDDGETLVPAAAPSVPGAATEPPPRLPIGDAGGPWGSAAQLGRPVVATDLAVEDWPWADGRERGPGRLACWALPLGGSPGTQRLGVLAILQADGRSPDAHDWELVERSGHLATIAIERAQAQAQLAHRALHDPLTGLANRRLFLDRLERALAAQRREPGFVAVLFLDLDRFKLVNDTLGHVAGDDLLRDVAARLEQILRPGDSIARFGGDEFAMLCEGLGSETQVTAIADRVVAAIGAPVQVEATDLLVTASVGIAVSGPRSAGGGRRAQKLLRDADTAAYRAKELGGGRHELFDDDLRKRAEQRLQIAAGLRRALEHAELRLHFQPEVRLADQQLVGEEALLRWEHPERGLLPPAEFIPVAEETGEIVSMGAWALREACNRLAARQGAGQQARTLAVNLSARQFLQPDLVGTVRDALAARKIPPSRLCLEVTETVLMSDAATATATLRALSAVGVHVAIDDFGTGYSSLAYLKRFPVTMLKIDRSFISGLDDPDGGDRAIVTAIIEMAHALGILVVGEGVETREQLRMLTEMGCDWGQGYLLGRPRPCPSSVGTLAPISP